jgi:ribosomal protein S18 acetylase RimI-like enzyme
MRAKHDLTFRLMTERDLTLVVRIADQVHPLHPESDALFAERLRLYPAGCFVLANGPEVAGYVISHPWRLKEPPALDTRLGALPEAPSTYYLHDMALLPGARGSGHASFVLELLIRHAQAGGHTNITLVAVNQSAPFWERHGFRVENDERLKRKLQSYGTDARFMVRNLEP